MLAWMSFLWYLECPFSLYIHNLIYFWKTFLDIFNYLWLHYFGFLLQGFQRCTYWHFFTCFRWNALSFKICFTFLICILYGPHCVFLLCLSSPCSFSFPLISAGFTFFLYFFQFTFYLLLLSHHLFAEFLYFSKF